MIDRAIEKINAEMQKDPSSRYMEIIGHYVIDRCDEALAAKIAAGKTLKDAMTAVERRAQSKRGGRAVVPMAPDEVFGEVDKYFGLSTDTAAQWKALGFPFVGTPAEEHPHASSVDIDLADFF